MLPLLAGLSLILGRVKAGHCSVEWGGGGHRGPHLHTDLDLLCDPHLDLRSEPHLDPPYILVSWSIMHSDIWISCAPQHPGLLCGLDSRPTVCPDLCLWCLDQLRALAFRPTVCLSRLSFVVVWRYSPATLSVLRESPSFQSLLGQYATPSSVSAPNGTSQESM